MLSLILNPGLALCHSKANTWETGSDERKAGLFKSQQPEKMRDSSLKNHLHLSAGRGFYEGFLWKENAGSVEGAMCKSAVCSKTRPSLRWASDGLVFLKGEPSPGAEMPNGLNLFPWRLVSTNL